MTQGRPAAVATAVAGVGALAAIGALGFQLANWHVAAPGGLHASTGDVVLTLTMTSFVAVGSVVARRISRNPVGWLLLGIGLQFELGLLYEGYVTHVVFAGHGTLPGATLAAWLLTWAIAPILAMVPLLFVLFPDGQVLSSRWRYVVALSVASGVLLFANLAFQPGPMLGVDSLASPIRRALPDALGGIAGVLVVIAQLGGLASLLVRFRRARSEQRLQTGWVLLGAVVVLLGYLVATIAGAAGAADGVVSILNTVPLVAIPLSIGLAVLRYRLYDIDLFISKTLVVGALTGFVTLVYVVIVATIGAIVGYRMRTNLALATLATAVVGLTLGPLRRRLQATVGRLAYRRSDLFRPDPNAAALPADDPPSLQPPGIAVRVLGGFRVFRDGELLGASAWQSKKARTLLKVLIARRGRAVPKDVLMEILWSDEPIDALSNRLSVALATLRGVLDPDKRYASDHFVRSDGTAIALELSHVTVDNERFLDAIAGLTGAETHPTTHQLEVVERLYTGEFMAEDIYEDWSQPARDEVRTAYSDLLRRIVGEARANGEVDRALRAGLTLLDLDPWDESAYLEIISILQTNGRFGEAQRQYQRYSDRMSELGIEPRPLAARP